MKTNLKNISVGIALFACNAIPSWGQISNCTITASESSICLGETSNLSVASNSCGFLPSALQTGINTWYSFCGNPNDLSPNNNHGVINGAVLTTDINNTSNSAYSLNGTNNTINIPNPFLGGVQVNQFAMNARVYFNSIANSPNIWGKTFFWGEVNFLVNNNGSVALVWANSITGNKYSSIYSQNGVITNNTWYDITVVFQSGTAQMYLNGNPITTNLQWTAQGGAILSTTNIENSCNFAQDANSSKLGVRNAGGSLVGYLNGKIDEFKIWNYALNTNQIQQNSQSSNLITTWSDGTTNQSGIQVQPSQTTTYSVTVSDGVNSCTDDIIIQVNIPQIDAGSDLNVCSGNEITLSATGATNYSWDNGVTQNIPFIPSISGIYTVTGTDAAGCTGSDQLSITVNSLPTVFAGNDIVVCEGTSVTLSGSGATNYSWDNSIIDGTAFNALSSTIYTVTGIDANGCESSDQVVVDVNPLPSVNAGQDQTICAGELITLNGSGASTYTWVNGVTDGIPFAPSNTQTYTLIGADGNGCENSDVVLVTVNSLPVVTGVIDQTIYLSTNNSTNFTVPSGASSYQWQSDAGFGFQNLSNAGQYSGVTTNTLIVSSISVANNNNQQFRCIVSDGNCSDTSDFALLTVTDVLSVYDINNSMIFIYPNPASEYLMLSASEELIGETYNIIDLNGKTLKEGTLTQKEVKIEIGNLSKGMYLLKIKNESEQTFRIIKN